MKNEPNKSVLECPDCKKPLVNIGSKLERIHPVARFITRHYAMIIVVVGLTMLSLIVGGYWGYDRFIGFAIISSILAPSAVMYVLVRLFPIYRVTECPYCGFEEVQRLGRSGDLM